MKGGKTEKIVGDAHYTISSSGTGFSELIIANVSAVDKGYYICNATINELNEASGYLQVLQGIFSFYSQIKEYNVVDFCSRNNSDRSYTGCTDLRSSPERISLMHLCHPILEIVVTPGQVNCALIEK